MASSPSILKDASANLDIGGPMATPLEGITVLDLSRGGTPLSCSMVLGDLGAKVINISDPHQRRRGRTDQASQLEERRNAAFDPLFRNKVSVELNLRHPEALKALHKLAEKADVFLEAFSPGVTTRLGVGYGTLKGMNPRLIYCSITGYGQDGPYRDVGGHDIDFLATSGSLVNIQEGEDGSLTSVNQVGIFTTRGVMAAVAILAALLARERTGLGQYVDIAISDASLYLLAPILSQYLQRGVLPSRGEPDLSGRVPYYALYKAKDGKLLSLACGEPHIYDALMTAVGKTEWLGKQREQSLYPAMRTFLRETFQSRPRDEWFDSLSSKGVSVAKVNSLSDVVTDPQVAHRDMVPTVGYLGTEAVRHVGVWPKFSHTPVAVPSMGVPQGSNTLEVLKGLGFSVEQLDVMRREGAI
ncbi:MAG: CoA transferase [Dehalococcoidia bacterium]|nr:CoA transferase [Dehalococcoidia bacterium]